MFTVCLALIEAKYKHGYELIFGITAVLDFVLIVFTALVLGVE